MRPFFLRSQARNAVVVGRIRFSDLELLRVVEGPGRFSMESSRIVSIPWDKGSALGEPLRDLLGWRTSEPVVLVMPTPPLIGVSETVRITLPGEARTAAGPAGAPLEPPSEHLKAAFLEAQWEVRERVRDQARRFFDCALEDLEVLQEDIRLCAKAPDISALEAVATCFLRKVESAGEVPSLPPDVPSCDLVLLPIVLSEHLSPRPLDLAREARTLSFVDPSRREEGKASLVLFEETRTSFVVRRAGIVEWLRTIPLGTDLIVAHLAASLACSAASAQRVLARADRGELPPESLRVLAKALRPLLPLFSGGFTLFGEELSEDARPAHVLVAGLWPSILCRVFCRPEFTARCALRSATPRVLPLPAFPGGGFSVGAAADSLPSLGLLVQVADAVLKVRRDSGKKVLMPPLLRTRARALATAGGRG